MTRFILLSFAFLGWGFWELSGGAAYEPREVAAPIFAPIVPLDAPRTPAKDTLFAEAKSVPTRDASNTDQITLVSTLRSAEAKTAPTPGGLDLRDQTDFLVQAALSADIPVPTPEPLPETAETRLSVVLQPAPLSGISIDGLLASTGPETGALTGQSISVSTFSRTEAPTVPAPAPAPVTSTFAPAPDLREISGDRVNMRAGPGTEYSVLDTLSLGDAVEVIGAEGDGWLKLRVLRTGQEGYMADWLVTAKAE